MARVMVDVTQDEIANGKICSSRECPVALAGNRLIDAAQYTINVGGRYFYVGNNNRSVLVSRQELPPLAQEFIRYFDAGKPVQPFSFPLDIPDEALSPEALAGGIQP